VTLEQIKADKTLADLPLIKQSRLSTMMLSGAQAERLLKLGNTKA
jgi:predicted RNA-binding protein with PUA-like domain